MYQQVKGTMVDSQTASTVKVFINHSRSVVMAEQMSDRFSHGWKNSETAALQCLIEVQESMTNPKIKKKWLWNCLFLRYITCKD